MGAQKLNVYSNSQLVTRQVNGEYEPIQERMQCYLQMILHLADHFEKVNFLQVLKAQNDQADHLAKLASSSKFNQAKGIRIKIQTKSSTNEVEVFLIQTP